MIHEPSWKNRHDFEFRLWVWGQWYDVPYFVWWLAGDRFLTGYREIS